ncbi:hypothetical protein MSG28_007114 [Choristoneura fumiferana]|uniref:Uncharacterized protein n=1 Tax=Choristoneura fumiferana TaxID=7141 RepID=A0ACC0JMQ3_CHOFU|nr:hypothetical protein MSG28_007114 [Choristoneura fumiferana]
MMISAVELRSLLLAVFVISNCITWTASRHHFTHNASGHRSRHRRQGAGLYLPASSVMPGGAGAGAWGEWGEVSPCSRTCGGGVASQKRICLEVAPDGRPMCTGGDTKYFSCQTQDCPAGSGDFRAEQCSAYNDVPFKGVKHTSLLLAVFVISNCITWTASRHHFTHNASGHRSRHRRQGAGLYLPASSVMPGGAGAGAWGEWGEVSPCSRTCGGGVASQKRICLEVAPDGRPMCTGGDTKYFSCQTQDCPAGSGDFRAEQCSAYNDVPFKGVKHTWIPYTNGPKPCELNCMPKGERFYYRHKAKVTDGTRCNDESFDVCVDGTCQPVGCDMMLGSNAREDKCRECRGNGTHCYTSKGRIDTTDLRKGYNDMLLIPEGATSILIEEIKDSNNYLALRSKKDNVYYLNGDYHIDFPRTLIIAGAPWHYERSQQGFAAPDKLRCMGPTTEPLYLSLLLQDENVGIDYEYSIPTALAPPPNQQYVWVHDDFTPCSATCGGGFQTRTVSCRSREELDVVDDNLCDEGLRPPSNETCNLQACAATWVEGPWSPCSKPCGQGGTRSRQIHCQKIISNGASSAPPSPIPLRSMCMACVCSARTEQQQQHTMQ